MEDSTFSLDQLQPGRNYSLVVAAVSSNMDSDTTELTYTTPRRRRTVPVDQRSGGGLV